jgi:hypothetical protein
MSGGVAIFDRDMAVSIHLLDKLMDLKTRRSYDAAGKHCCEEWVERTKHQRMANGFWRKGKGPDMRRPSLLFEPDADNTRRYSCCFRKCEKGEDIMRITEFDAHEVYIHIQTKPARAHCDPFRLLLSSGKYVKRPYLVSFVVRMPPLLPLRFMLSASVPSLSAQPSGFRLPKARLSIHSFAVTCSSSCAPPSTRLFKIMLSSGRQKYTRL